MASSSPPTLPRTFFVTTFRLYSSQLSTLAGL
jgi:hypothetical protein